jgi:integrase/recombinase XerD
VGAGDRQRHSGTAEPLDADVASVILTHLLAEWPGTVSARVFHRAKGLRRGQPLTAAGSAVSSATAGVPAGNPHALRHAIGTA